MRGVEFADNGAAGLFNNFTPIESQASASRLHRKGYSVDTFAARQKRAVNSPSMQTLVSALRIFCAANVAGSRRLHRWLGSCVATD
jgi:hypothetical protein